MHTYYHLFLMSVVWCFCIFFFLSLPLSSPRSLSPVSQSTYSTFITSAPLSHLYNCAVSWGKGSDRLLFPVSLCSLIISLKTWWEVKQPAKWHADTHTNIHTNRHTLTHTHTRPHESTCVWLDIKDSTPRDLIIWTYERCSIFTSLEQIHKVCIVFFYLSTYKTLLN